MKSLLMPDEVQTPQTTTGTWNSHRKKQTKARLQHNHFLSWSFSVFKRYIPSILSWITASSNKQVCLKNPGQHMINGSGRLNFTLPVLACRERTRTEREPSFLEWKSELKHLLFITHPVSTKEFEQHEWQMCANIF